MESSRLSIPSIGGHDGICSDCDVDAGYCVWHPCESLSCHLVWGLTMLTWIKKRVRDFEGFDWATENNDRPSRKDYIKLALEDWQWMTGNATGMEVV